ncbi:MAG: L-threonylcarbamoyladenylate synthase [Syntrophales bacterium]|nr:L-threonylcarbamoyladenylate synthase [Syntrophales bacterium]
MPIILRIDPKNPDKSLIVAAVEILKKGGVIAYPTETFYGLGADAKNVEAVEKIYDIKGRDYKDPVSIIIGDKQDLTGFAEDVPEVSRRLMEKFWPGGLTLVFKASSNISPRLTGGTGKIGIRLSSNIIASHLSKTLSGPITATSANLSGAKECSSADEVINCFKDKIDMVVDGGQTPGGLGSTIVDVTTDPPTILRQGIIPPSLLRYTLRKI